MSVPRGRGHRRQGGPGRRQHRVVGDAEPAHDRAPTPSSLHFHPGRQPAASFVGDGDLSDDRLVAVGVTTALVGVGDRKRPARTDRNVGLSDCARQRPMVSVMTTARVDSAAAKATPAMRAPALASGSRGRAKFIGGHIRPVDTGRGLDQPAQRFVGDQRCGFFTRHPRSSVDKAPTRRAVPEGQSARTSASPPGKTLEGDDDDVVVVQLTRRAGSQRRRHHGVRTPAAR